MKSNELRKHYGLLPEWPIIGIGHRKKGCYPFVQSTIGDEWAKYVVEYAGNGTYFQSREETEKYIAERKFNFDKIEWNATEDI